MPIGGIKIDLKMEQKWDKKSFESVVDLFHYTLNFQAENLVVTD